MEHSNPNNNNMNNPFWDFVRSCQRPGFGVDHLSNGPQFSQGFPFDAAGLGGWGGPWAGPGPWGGWGRAGRHDRRGRHGHHHHHGSGDEDSQGEETSPETETMRDTPENAGDQPPPPPPGAFPPHPPHPSHHRRHHHGPPNAFGGPPPFGPNRRRGGRHGRGGRRHGSPPPYEGPFDFRPMMHALSSHPFAQAFRDYAEQARNATTGDPAETANRSQEEQGDAFTPPVDIFNAEGSYVLHVALPGASKEDVGVSWDGEQVKIAGVIYRPGNEEFLRTLATSERRVGMFERTVKLPPAGQVATDDVDGYAMSAKMENGILVITVPKIEKDNSWTEIHKVDIE
ncbi:HSP20-like chaperone [Xylariaceae sp. FL1272]|nr:HSP20-like chaperone [Xylariaceae sp. FL1272]